MRRLCTACAWAAVMLASSAASAQTPAAKPTAAPASRGRALDTYVRERIDAILKPLDDGGDFAAADHDLIALFDQVIANAAATDPAPFADADYAMQLVTVVQDLPKEQQRDAYTFLRDHDALARELILSMLPEDRFRQIYPVLQKLRAAHGDRIAQYPALTAAICLVHDHPITARSTVSRGSKGETIDPAAVFAYYTSNESRMLFGLKSLPPQAFIYMVDSTATPEELSWALAAHAGDHNVGQRYKDIVYDTPAYKQGAPKKIASMPYSLQNIAKVGGVCEEQAYYAEHVAKAIGVPAAMIQGRGNDVAHAWVGFLQQRGTALEWNTREGHYNEYQKVLGYVWNPQTQDGMTDDHFAASAENFGLPPQTRYEVTGLIEAAHRTAAFRSGGHEPRPLPESGLTGVLGTPRATDAGAQQALLEAAINLAPFWEPAWDGVREVSRDMTAKDRQRWFDRLERQCGHKHAGFAYAVLVKLIASVPDPQEQSQAWDWAFTQYRANADLAAEARMRQGAMWEKAGDKNRAYQAYFDVARQFPNNGARAVTALEMAEKMLKESGKDTAAADMYGDAWRRMSRPSASSPWAFRESNFYRVGDLYAKALERSGRAGEAEAVRRQLAAGDEKSKK